MTNEAIEELYKNSFSKHQTYGFVVSTCNRTVFFLYGAYPERIEAEITHTWDVDLLDIGYRYIGKKAVQHLFEVASGMDSQIPGDFEIVGQIRRAYNHAKEHRAIDGTVEKLVNEAIHTSRKVKNQTQLSTGTASTSYAAAQLLQEQLPNFETAQILVLGAGEIGLKVAGNLAASRPANGLYIANRTGQRAKDGAARLGIAALPLDQALQNLDSFDAVIGAVAVDEPIVHAAHKVAQGAMLIDLSIPAAICKEAHSGDHYYDVDQISTIVQTTVANRTSAIPAARKIVLEEVQKHFEWEVAQYATPTLQDLRETIEKQWEQKNVSPQKSERVGAKITARLFQRVRKNPKELIEIKRWLRQRRTP